MIDYKKKYLKYKLKYIQLINIIGGKKTIKSKKLVNESKPSIRFQQLNDYFISIRNKKIIKDIKKLQEKYHIK
mgnify:CR=1 FL=1|tara:strand:+ start:2593 stop:2811 length:219 start_codon:yes stop_codon:yes gene_type:complete